MHVSQRSGSIDCVALSADGRHALSIARADGFAVWDIDSGQPIRTITTLLNGITRACFTPDARRVVTLSDRRTLIVWDLESGRPVRAVRSPSALNELRLSPDGRQALTDAGDTLLLWDVDSGRELRALRRDWSSVEQACFSPDGSSVLASYKDGALVLWDDPLRSGVSLRTRVLSYTYL